MASRHSGSHGLAPNKTGGEHQRDRARDSHGGPVVASRGSHELMASASTQRLAWSAPTFQAVCPEPPRSKQLSGRTGSS